MSNQDPPSASKAHTFNRYNQIQAKQELMSILLEGKLSGESEGWLSLE